MTHYLLLFFHFVMTLFGLWSSTTLLTDLGDDFLGINSAAAWLSLSMALISATAVIVLINKIRWAISYASITALLYIGLFALSLSAYLS